MTQQTKNPIEDVHRKAAEKLWILDSYPYASKNWEKAAAQIIANHFPRLPLTEEENAALKFIQEGYKDSQEKCEKITYIKQLLSIIQKIRQQGDRKAWLESVADSFVKKFREEGWGAERLEFAPDTYSPLTDEKLKSLILSCMEEEITSAGEGVE